MKCLQHSFTVVLVFTTIPYFAFQGKSSLTFFCFSRWIRMGNLTEQCSRFVFALENLGMEAAVFF